MEDDDGVGFRLSPPNMSHAGQRTIRDRFREDLYYRLDAFAMRLPPLRDRGGGIPPPGETFLAMNYSASDPAVAAFVLIPLLLVVALISGTALAWRRSGAAPRIAQRASLVTGAGAAAWMAATWAVADSGALRAWDRTPPPLGLLFVAIAALSIGIAFSGLGRRLARFVPLWALVGVQAFRLPLELAMHSMYEQGIMPQQMSYSGRNFDIVTGITAIAVAAIVRNGRGGRRLVAAWNVLGLGLLLNIVVVAILSTPVFRYFGDDHLNVWVTFPPFVWLPAVMVLAAFAGHLVIFRALRHPSSP